MKEEIIANLKEFNEYHGVLFTSEEDAIEYYKGLVELIEKLSNKAILKLCRQSRFLLSTNPVPRTPRERR